MNKSWIKVHTGLTDDPKHRERIGVRVWYFMKLIDMADYETGIVWFYTDALMADLMGMSISTLRTWRRDLENMGYIKCYPGDQCQHIMIAKWRNPKLVNASQINVGGWPEVITPPLNKVITPPSSKVITPTLDSQESHLPTGGNGGNGDRPNIFVVYEQNIGMLTPMIAEDLNDWLDTVPEDWIEAAIKIASQANKRSMRYISGILKRCNDEGHPPEVSHPSGSDDDESMPDFSKGRIRA